MAERRLTPDERQLVLARARGCCEYCRSQERFAMQPFAIEHILPRSLDGETAPHNLAVACQGCNNHKYNKTRGKDPVTEKSVPLFHPRKQRWRDHFAWDENCTLILGLTPTGRATVEVLHLNREGVVNLRRILYAVGEHPPAEPGQVG
jgi:5-methylcytosine-specific restriction endonuclease McrA